jgi:hypothetical protein
MNFRFDFYDKCADRRRRDAPDVGRAKVGELYAMREKREKISGFSAKGSCI